MLRSINISPPVANEMEIWELAVLLEADLEPDESDLLTRLEAEKHTLAERAARISTAGPDEDVDISAQVMRQMGIRTE